MSQLAVTRVMAPVDAPCVNGNGAIGGIMNATFQAAIPKKQVVSATMLALVFRGPNQIRIEQVSIPRPGLGEAVIRVTLTVAVRP